MIFTIYCYNILESYFRYIYHKRNIQTQSFKIFTIKKIIFKYCIPESPLSKSSTILCLQNLLWVGAFSSWLMGTKEVMEFQLSYFKSWKMMLWKCCTQYASKPGKLSSGHRTGKGQFWFQSQRKAMSKNAQTTTELHSSHMLVK